MANKNASEKSHCRGNFPFLLNLSLMNNKTIKKQNEDKDQFF